jgi:hypothetical protein
VRSTSGAHTPRESLVRPCEARGAGAHNVRRGGAGVRGTRRGIARVLSWVRATHEFFFLRKVRVVWCRGLRREVQGHARSMSVSSRYKLVVVSDVK